MLPASAAVPGDLLHQSATGYPSGLHLALARSWPAQQWNAGFYDPKSWSQIKKLSQKLTASLSRGSPIVGAGACKLLQHSAPPHHSLHAASVLSAPEFQVLPSPASGSEGVLALQASLQFQKCSQQQPVSQCDFSRGCYSEPELECSSHKQLQCS